jgi:hypothetical protein
MDRDSFTSATHKKKSTQVTPAATTVEQRRQILSGVRNYVSLLTISKKEKSNALTVSPFSPNVTTVDVQKSLKAIRSWSAAGSKSNLTHVHLVMFC